MKAIVVTDKNAGTAGMRTTNLDEPKAMENDVIVRVEAAGFTPGELSWPATWQDRTGADRTPSVPGHELAGVVEALGYGTTGLTVGQRVFGFADWTRNGSLAERVAVEARNLAPLPADVSFVIGAALPISGVAAWQALFTHGELQAGQTVMIHGAAGGVGSIATQLAHEAGAVVVATGRGTDRTLALSLGADEFIDLGEPNWAERGPVDLVFDVIGGAIGAASAALVRPGGSLVSIAAPPTRVPVGGRAMFFVVEPNRDELTKLVERVRARNLRVLVDRSVSLEAAPAAFNGREHPPGRTIVDFSRSSVHRHGGDIFECC